MKVLEEKHKLPTRWFHWVNFPLLSAMIFSGLLIYWAYDPYRIGLGGITLFVKHQHIAQTPPPISEIQFQPHRLAHSRNRRFNLPARRLR